MDNPSITHDHRYSSEVIDNKNSMEGKEKTINTIAGLEVTMSPGGFPKQAPQTPAVCPKCGTDSHPDLAYYGSTATLSTKDILHKCSRCDEYFCQNAEKDLGKMKGKEIETGFYSVNFKATKKYMKVDSLYQCLLCNKMYKTLVERNTHMAKHMGVDTHMCTQCGFVSNEKSAVEAHMATHREVPSYECPMCCQMFETATEMDQHLTMTGHLGDTMQRCLQCSFASTLKTKIMTVSVVKSETEKDVGTGEITQNINIRITYPHCSQNKQPGNKDQSPDGESSLQQLSNPRQPAEITLMAVTDEGDTHVSENGTVSEDDPHGGNKESYTAETGNSECSTLPVDNEQPEAMLTDKTIYVCMKCKVVYSEESAFQAHLLTHSVKENSIQGDEGGDTPSTPGRDTGQNSHIPRAAYTANPPKRAVNKKKRKPKSFDSEIHKCPYCSSEFGYKCFLRNHVMSHSRCYLCESTFSSPKELKEHMPIHTAGKEFKCTVCYKWFSDLMTHMTTHTGEIGKGGVLIQGSLCTEAPTTQEDTTLHSLVKPADTSVSEQGSDEQGKPHKCCVCGKVFSSKSSLLEHILTHGSRDHVCTLCEQPFSCKSELKVHIMRHTGDKPHQCHQCGKRYIDARDLNYHLASSHSEGVKPYQCSQCGKQFPTRKGLNKHIRSHSEGKPHTCSQCDKQYKTESLLKRHMVTHTEKFQCSYCGKQFCDAAALTRHEMVHTGEAPFPCSLCDKRYITRQRLDMHMLTHTGERPHMCSVCGKTFPSGPRLTAHMKIHTGEKPYVCSECGKAFAFVSALNMHKFVHTGEKRYSCTGCGRSFAFRYRLKRHACVPKKRGRKKKKPEESTETAVAVSSLDQAFVPVYMTDIPEPYSLVLMSSQVSDYYST